MGRACSRHRDRDRPRASSFLEKARLNTAKAEPPPKHLVTTEALARHKSTTTHENVGPEEEGGAASLRRVARHAAA